MTFLSSFEVVRYRGLDGVSFPHFTRANLVTGVNGIGKTAALEAMWLFTGRYNTPLLWNANVQRSTKPALDPVARLTTGALEFRGVENGKPQSLKTEFKKVAEIEIPKSIGNPTENPFMGPPVVGWIHTDLNGKPPKKQNPALHVTPWGSVAYQIHEPPLTRPNCTILGTRFQPEAPNEYLQRYSDMVRANHKKEFTDAINLILPRIRDAEILTNELGESYLSAVTTDNKQLPLHDLGGGVVRLYQLFLSFFTSRGGVLFADEVENGLHHSVQSEIWARSREWMRQWNVQLVATTHSHECIGAAMVAFEQTPDELSIHKLFVDENTGKVDVTTFTGETLEGARDLDLETR